LLSNNRQFFQTFVTCKGADPVANFLSMAAKESNYYMPAVHDIT
jgi:hypothetical protein